MLGKSFLRKRFFNLDAKLFSSPQPCFGHRKQSTKFTEYKIRRNMSSSGHSVMHNKNHPQLRELHIDLIRKALLISIRCLFSPSFSSVCWWEIFSGEQAKSFTHKLFATKRVYYSGLFCKIELTLTKFGKWGIGKQVRGVYRYLSPFFRI